MSGSLFPQPGTAAVGLNRRSAWPGSRLPRDCLKFLIFDARLS
jgi:hypothetical protein